MDGTGSLLNASMLPGHTQDRQVDWRLCVPWQCPCLPMAASHTRVLRGKGWPPGVSSQPRASQLSGRNDGTVSCRSFSAASSCESRLSAVGLYVGETADAVTADPTSGGAACTPSGGAPHGGRPRHGEVRAARMPGAQGPRL